MAQTKNSKQLRKECAVILESMKVIEYTDTHTYIFIYMYRRICTCF